MKSAITESTTIGMDMQTAQTPHVVWSHVAASRTAGIAQTMTATDSSTAQIPTARPSRSASERCAITDWMMTEMGSSIAPIVPNASPVALKSVTTS